jgi:hypothetical protein
MENERTKNLHPDYEYRECLEHGIGKFSVHRETGKACDCKMEWNEDGTVLSCPVCGLDGT